jgi:hypothetical protein
LHSIAAAPVTLENNECSTSKFFSLARPSQHITPAA